MPLPSNYSTRTVHGRWIAFPDGAPTTGTITFRASVAHLVSSSDELVILTRPISADLDGNGDITVELPTTSDPDISPTGFTYSVVETLGANGTERAYSIDVPEGAANLELATVTPVAPVDDASPYLLVADRGSPGGVAALDAAGLVPRAQLPTTVDSVNGETGDVSLNASDVGALPDTFTAPVQSVNTFTGDVNLSAGDVNAAPDTHGHDTEYAALGHDHDSAYASAGHTHPEPDHPVDSVDGRTGEVTLDDLYAGAGHSHAHPVTSVNTETGDVTLDAADVGASPDTHHHDADYAAAGHNHDAAYAAAGHSHSHPVDSVDGRTGTVTLGDLYADEGHNHDAAYAAAGHGHDYPVDSVNGEIGAVQLDAGDVGAAPSGHTHSEIQPGTERLDEIDLSVTQEFTGISQAFTNLLVEFFGLRGSSGKTTIFLRFNSDNGSNYTSSLFAHLGNGDTEEEDSPNATGARVARMGSSWTSTASFLIPGYSRTSTGGKALHAWGMAIDGTLGGSNIEQWHGGGIWQSNDAITSIEFLVIGGGGFGSQSRAVLYGMR